MRKVFMRKWRKWQVGVICGTQNHLRIRGKHLNAFCSASKLYNLSCLQYTFTCLLRGNSRTYSYVEVSGHNLESSLTWGFYLRFLPFYKMLFSKLEFSSLIDCFVWISETIREVWLSVRSFCFVYTYNNKHGLDIKMIGYIINLMSFKCQ